MKTHKIAVIGLILLSFHVTAQYGGYGGDYGNGYGSRGGYGNRFGMQNNAPTSKPDPAMIEKEKAERINKYMEKLKTELNLDELQFIAIQNDIIANGKSIDIVMKKENSEDEKANQIKSLVESLQKNINSYLNPEQKEKYKVLNEEKNLNKKEKTRKEKNKEKDEEKTKNNDQN